MTKYKSKFEEYVADSLGDVQYEVDTLPYIQPETKRNYKPDFKIGDKKYIECKGVFTLDDRKKMTWLKEQYPDYTFYLLFYNAQQKLRKGSKTTYAEWADKNGFIWADWYRNGRKIPEDWFSNTNNNNKE